MRKTATYILDDQFLTFEVVKLSNRTISSGLIQNLDRSFFDE